ncbi:hypothetical protein NC651_019192 [Populus alba x Populus x berolinensis]|nr:hypothetical protein NC651_019192 [Populus alba x Populus x berolinensis]
MYGESMIRDEDWEQYLNKNWNREIVTEEQPSFQNLLLRYGLYQIRIEKRGLDWKLVYSNETALDVLPNDAGKGQRSCLFA